MRKLDRLHITGASGAGVSTLGAALAATFDVPQHDVDDFYWMPTTPPFSTKRQAQERLDLLKPLLASGGWVLSGSLMSWGEPLLAQADAIIFVVTPSDVRLDRLRKRERLRYGSGIDPGGAMHEIHVAFMEWAASYDDPNFTGRSRAAHDAWLQKQGLPVIRADGSRPVGELVATVAAEVDRLDL